MIDTIERMIDECYTLDEIVEAVDLPLSDIYEYAANHLRKRLGTPKVENVERRLSIYSMFASGWGAKEVAAHVGIHYSTAYRYRREWETMQKTVKPKKKYYNLPPSTPHSASFAGGAVFGPETQHDTIWKE